MSRLKTTLMMTTTLVLLSGTCRAADASPDETVTTFFKTYCLHCHNAQKQEGQFRLDSLPREFVDQATAERWGEVVFRMNSGEMPPKDQPQPKADELGRVVDRNFGPRSGNLPAERNIVQGPLASVGAITSPVVIPAESYSDCRSSTRSPGSFSKWSPSEVMALTIR